MKGPVRNAEVWLLRLLFAVSLASILFHAFVYQALGSESPMTHPNEVIAAGSNVAARPKDANDIALEAILSITHAGMRDRAFHSIKWSITFTALIGYLLWRVRGTGPD